MGESLALVGNNSIGSNWDSKKALHFKTNPQIYPRWQAEYKIIINSKYEASNLEYKYIKIKNKGAGIDWESGNNRKLNLSYYFDQVLE